jgi:Dockerin type I domain
MSLSSLFHFVSRAGTTVSVTVASVGFAAIANAGDRPPVVTPYGTVMSEFDTAQRIGWYSDRGGVVDLQTGADHIVGQQCGNGGWGWPHDDCGTTYNNITGPIAIGVMRAYASTQDPTHLASAVDGGDYDLTFVYGNTTPRFGAFMAPFLHELSGLTGDPTYSNHAATFFYGALDAGTYGDPGTMNTAGWIAAVQTARTGTWVNLRPWEFHLQMTAAADLGTPAQEALFLGGVLDGLNTLDNTNPGAVYSDIIGLSGGVRGLGLSGTTSFAPIVSPLHPLINGINNLTVLANVLAGLQNPDGSWYWHSGLGAPALDDEDTQTSAYAVLALIAAQEAGAGDYTAEISLGRQWLGSMQIGSGGFLSYPGGTENTEVEGEALTALSSTSSLSLNTAMCESSGTLTVTIDMSNTAVDVVGGQFFLDFNTAALTFVSAVPGGGTFTTEVFESVGAGTIDYAVGVPLGGPGTNTGETMATLTFLVNAENCTPEAGLVAFRANFPPSRLTDDLGNPVPPALVDLNAVSFDETPPVVTPPSDITMNADAGVCTATFDFNEPFDTTVVTGSQAPGVWYTDRYAPAVFENAVFDGDNRLKQGVRSADNQANRPGSFSSSFYNYQGRKLDVGIGIPSTISIDIYVDSTWLSGTRAGLWTTMSNGNLTFPIIEYCVNGDNGDGNGPTYTGFRYWQSNIGWTATSFENATTDQWYTLEIELNPTDVNFSIDGTPIGTVDNLGANMIDNVILNVHNEGPAGDYDVYWDNLTTGPVWGTATDNCTEVAVTYERGDNPALGFDDPFPAGVTTVTWTATDPCGNTDTGVQFVTVNSMNTLNVAVELQATVDSGPFDRCITFELIPTGGGAPIVVSETMTFTGGIATAAVEVPCGDYECIMARDTLHTLRKTDSDDFAIAGPNYTADFTVAGGGDALIGGNLNDDDFIDILDFGIFIGQFGSTPGADTICGFVGPHADITGDGTVGSGDFTFIQINFLEFSEAPCTGAPLLDGGNNFAGNGNTLRRDRPVISISVDDLIAMGMADLAQGDLNNDGMLDESDVAAFMGGMRPDHIADIDRSGTVDFYDLQTLMDHMGEQAQMPYDMNGDGVVNLDDLQFVIQRIGMNF